MAEKTINPLSELTEFWSLRCCTAPMLLASSLATVTLTKCLPSLVNMLFQSLGRPFFFTDDASTTAAVRAKGSWVEGFRKGVSGEHCRGEPAY